MKRLRDVETRAGSVALAGVAIAASGALGIAPGLLTLAGTLALFALLTATLAAWLLRKALIVISQRRAVDRRAAPSGLASDAERALGTVPRSYSASDLRFARTLFYLGALTIGEPIWRKGVTLSEAFFLMATVSCVFAVLRGRAVARLPALLVLGAGLFGVGAAISSVHAASPGGSIFNTIHGIYVLAIWPWTGAMVLRGREHLLTVLALWSASLALDGVGAMAQIFGVHTLVGASVGGRATAFTPTPNDLGGAASIALVPAMFLATRRVGVGRPLAVARWVTVSLIAIALVLGGSVSGMSGAAAGLLIWLVAPQVRASARLAVVGALSVVVVVLLLAGPKTTGPLRRLQLVSGNYSSQTGAGSGLDRLAIVKTIWPRILNDPFVGTGVDVSGTVVTIISDGGTQSYQVHGAPLAAWYEAGILGLIGFGILIIAHCSTGWRSVRRADSEEDQLAALALLSAFLAFIVFAMTSPFLFQQYGWFSGVLLVAWSVRSDQVEASARTVLAGPWSGRSTPRMA